MNRISNKILVVDDDKGIQSSLKMLLEEDYRVETLPDAESTLKRLEAETFSVILLDIGLPGMGGEQLLSAIKANWPETEVIMVTAVKDVDQAVRCMKLGAYDFLSKPWDVSELKAILRRAVEKWELTKENFLFQRHNEESLRKASEIIGSSKIICDLKERIKKIAVHDSLVLIQGESGTGKELVARAIHAQSSRSKGRFVAISCAAIPADLAESELFGHEKGSFSSAIKERIGKFEYASGGILFLDDVSALSLDIQAKLLRVLQEKEITRVGSNQLIPVDVRVLSSTNQDLRKLVSRGLFREDLYWRLCGIPIQVPPLKERGEDVLELFKEYVRRSSHHYGRQVPKISQIVEQALLRHRFPGNIRELINLAETVVVLCEDDEIQVSSLPIQLLMNKKSDNFIGMERIPMKKAVQEFERQLIVRTLKVVNWNQSKASRQLGIHRNTLIFKMKEMDISKKK